MQTVDEASTRERVARRVRITAKEKGFTKANLRDALGYVDWRAAKDRWDGKVNFTVPQLARIADALKVDPGVLMAGADESEETD